MISIENHHEVGEFDYDCDSDEIGDFNNNE